MAVGEHESGETERYRARSGSIMPREAYGWAASMLKRRWKLTAFFVLAAFYYGPMNLYQVAVLPGMDPEPPARIVVQYAAMWLPVALVVQTLAYRYAAVEYGLVEESRSNLWVAVRRVPTVVALAILVGTAYVVLAIVLAFVGALVASVVGGLLTTVLGLVALVVSLPKLVRVVSAVTLAFPAAVIDGGIVGALDGGLAAGRVAPLTVFGLVLVGAVPMIAFEAAVGEANTTMVVLGVAYGLWLTITQIALARAYLEYRVPPS